MCNIPLDQIHLTTHAQAIFPGSKIEVAHAPDDMILIHVDDRRYACEIGSDDDAYVFSDGAATFEIPLMDIF